MWKADSVINSVINKLVYQQGGRGVEGPIQDFWSIDLTIYHRVRVIQILCMKVKSRAPAGRKDSELKASMMVPTQWSYNRYYR